MTAGAPRIAVVEDHALLAEALLVALGAEGFHVTSVPVPATARSAMALLGTLLAAAPEVVLLDLDLGVAGDAVPLIEPLQTAGSAVVIVTGSTDLARWGECLAHGARVVLPKSAGLDLIAGTARQVAAGSPGLDDFRRGELIDRWRCQRDSHQSLRGRLDQLTRREGQVLAALVQGTRVRDIAVASGVSETTVRTQVRSILTKLGVSSQIAAVAIAREAGWEPEGAP